MATRYRIGYLRAPGARGGGTVVEREPACGAWHLAHHDGTLAITRDGDEVTFRFEGRNNFTRVTRELATKKALQAHGLGLEQVSAIMMRTIATVGQGDLSEEQWITIALRYAKQLAS